MVSLDLADYRPHDVREPGAGVSTVDREQASRHIDTTYMLHLRLTAERFDAIIEVSYYTRVLYAYDAFLRYIVDGRRGRLHTAWLRG